MVDIDRYFELEGDGLQPFDFLLTYLSTESGINYKQLI